MTLALGMTSMGAIFVCADSHVIAEDGTVTSGYKIAGRQGTDGVSYIIANASNDGNAANMVGEEILEALGQTAKRETIEPVVKRMMKRWYSSYTKGNAPPMQFVLAARTGKQSRSLYFCEPPNTIVRKHLHESVVIGSGGQIVEPLIDEVVRGPLLLREALIRAAYLMYRAKKNHIFLKGSETDVMVISEADGSIRTVSREEMEQAEKLGPDVDFMLRYCYLGLLGVGHVPQFMKKDFLKGMNKKFLESKERADQIAFPSLTGMAGI